MELGQFTLADYIDYFKGTKPPKPDIDFSTHSPHLVHLNCSFHDRMRNMWVIGKHIADGLNFMHRNGHVHRDLKPSNSLFLLKSD
jgi:hypothetical protein